MITAHPNLGTVKTLTPGHMDFSEMRRVLQDARKLRKRKVRGKGVPLLTEEAADRTNAWLADNDAYVTDLMNGTHEITRVALAGDWHGNDMAAAAAFQQAAEEKADVVVQVGDLGVWPGQYGQEYLDLLETFTEVYKLPLLFLDGNHEDFDQLEAFTGHPAGVGALRPNVLHLKRGTVWTWAGYRFGALGGAVSIDKGTRMPGVSWWPQEEITDADVDLLLKNAAGAPLDVLLTHDTVSDAPLPTDPGRLPHGVQLSCDISRQMVYRAAKGTTPKLLVHGHYHEFKEYETAYAQVLALHMEQRHGAMALLALGA